MFPLMWILMLFMFPSHTLRQPYRTLYWCAWSEMSADYPNMDLKPIARWNYKKARWDTKWVWKIRPRLDQS